MRTDFLKGLIITGGLLITACNNSSAPRTMLQLSGLTMGTTYSLTINEPDRALDPVLIKKSVDKLLDALNASMSTYMPDSEISRINQSTATDWIPISADLYQVINTSQQVSMQSQGAFDITAGKLVNLWGFGPEGKPDRIPDPAEIEITLSATGFENIELDATTQSMRKLIPDIYIDLSGIGQGYAVDRIAQLFEDQFSIQNYLIEISGDIRAKGVNGEGKPWRIGIEKPLSGQRAVQRTLALNNSALSTSGDYRNFFEIDGAHYSHIIDPDSGRPIRHQLVSVTVLHDQCTIADAWDTALLVLGPEQGLETANQLGLAALFILKTDAGFHEQMSASLVTKLQKDVP